MCFEWFFFFKCSAKYLKVVLTFFLPSSLICVKDDSVKEKVAYPSTSFYLGKLIFRDKLFESKVTDNRIHSGQTQVPCQFFLLVLPYPRQHLWNQTEFINEQMYCSRFPLPAVIQWTQFASVFEISLFSSSYNSLLYREYRARSESAGWVAIVTKRDCIMEIQAQMLILLAHVCALNVASSMWNSLQTICRYIKWDGGISVALINL